MRGRFSYGGRSRREDGFHTEGGRREDGFDKFEDIKLIILN